MSNQITGIPESVGEASEAMAYGGFASGVALTFATRLLMLVGAVGASVIVGRWLGPEGLGALAVLNVTVALALQIGSAGLPSANTYFLSQDRKRLGPAWANAIIFAFVWGALLLLFVVALAEIKPALFGSVPANLVVIAAISIPFQLLTLLGLNVLLAMDRIGQMNLVDSMSPLLVLVSAIIVLLILHSRLSVLVTFNTAATIVLAFWMIWMIARLLNRRRDADAFRPNGALFLSTMKYGLKFSIPVMAAILIFRFDLLIVNHFRGAAEAGVYAVASQTANLLLMLPGVIGTLLFPRLASAKDRRGEFAAEVTRHASFVMLLMCVAAAAASFALPLVYGARFADATVQLLILLPGVYLVSIESVLVQHFMGTGLPVAVPIFWLFTLAVSLGLNFALVPTLGARGAALTSTLSYALIFALVAVYFCLKTGKTPSEIFLLRSRELRGLLARALRAIADQSSLADACMRIVLLVLSGDSRQARARLLRRQPAAEIESIARDELEKGGSLDRVAKLRSLKPDTFAVATERLAWQRGQNTLMLFGVLAGARRVILIDAYNDSREETRGRILSRMLFRLASEFALSALAIAKTRSRLKQLERAIRNREKSVSSSSDKGARIAYLRSTPSPGTPAGGASTHIKGFVSAATELGTQVNLISNDYIAGLDEKELTLVDPEPLGTTRAAFDLRNNLIFSAGALREIERVPVDLIYQRYGRFTWAGVEGSLRTGAPLFLEYNGSEVWIGKHWDMSGMIPLLERFERLNLDAAARIFVVSEVERRNLLRAGFADEKIVVNPNGVDTEEFRPDIGGAAVRRQLGVREDEVLAGFVGTFGPWHGVLTLAEAITLLPDHCGVRFLLVGAGRFRDEVERLVRAAGKAERVIFAGHVEHERVPVLLDACEILLSPHVPLEDGSEFFGSPTKLFEYMAMGKGIIASRLGQIGEVLADNETALLVEPGNAGQLADAILCLGRSRELREGLGAAARRVAVERHTWKHNAARVLSGYRDLVET